MTEEKGKKEIHVTAITVNFHIPATERATEVKGSLRTDYEKPGFGLHLDNRSGLFGEELDLVVGLRAALAAEPVCKRLKRAEEPKEAE